MIKDERSHISEPLRVARANQRVVEQPIPVLECGEVIAFGGFGTFNDFQPMESRNNTVFPLFFTFGN